ncbi:MAG: SDR family oxidoreductase [Planctomycetota bacterium]
MSKVALITGATAGFGEACARTFINNHWKIIITGRRENRLTRLQNELGGPSRVHALCFDIRDFTQMQSALQSIPVEFKDIDVLVNNAGLALGLEPVHETSINNWETMIDTNIKGLAFCTRLVLPGMVEQRRGHIINIGSMAGTWPYPGGNVYGATKAFVKQFSNNLKADLIGTPIRVTNIEPGLAETEFSIVRFNGDEKRAKEFYKGTQPLTGQDIADIVFWVSMLPPHVNINSLEVMPVCQSWSPLALHREQA